MKVNIKIALTFEKKFSQERVFDLFWLWFPLQSIIFWSIFLADNLEANSRMIAWYYNMIYNIITQ